MKGLLFLPLLFLSLQAWSKISSEKDLGCLTELKELKVTEQKACLNRLLTYISDKPEEASNYIPLFQAIEHGEYGEDIASYLKERKASDISKANEDLQGAIELLTEMSNANGNRLAEVIGLLSFNYSTEKKVQKYFREVLKASKVDSELFVKLVEFLSSEFTKEPLRDALAELEKQIGFQTLALDFVLDRKLKHNTRDLIAIYLLKRDSNKLFKLARTRLLQDQFFKKVLFQDKTSATVLLMEKLLRTQPDDHLDVIPYLLDIEDQRLHRRLFNLMLETEKEEVQRSILAGIINQRSNEFNAELFNILLSREVSLGIKSLILNALIQIPNFTDSVLQLLEEDQFDLNISKDLVCNFSNGNNTKTRSLLEKFLQSQNIEEELKNHALSCLRYSMNMALIPEIKKVFYSAEKPATRLLAIQLISKYLSTGELARLVRDFPPQLNDTELLQLLGYFSGFETSPAIEFFYSVLKQRPVSTNGIAINNISSNIQNAHFLFNYLLKSDYPHKSLIIMSACHKQQARPEYLNDYIKLPVFSHLAETERKELLQCLRDHGDRKTLAYLELYQDQLSALAGTELLPNLLESLRKVVESEEMTKSDILELSRRLQSEELSLTDTLTVLNYLHNGGKGIPEADQLLALDNITTFFSSKFQGLTPKGLSIFYQLYETFVSLEHKGTLRKSDLQKALTLSPFTRSFFVHRFAQHGLMNTTSMQKFIQETEDTVPSDDFHTLTTFIVLKNILTLSNHRMYEDAIDLVTATKLRSKLHASLRTVLKTIAPFHPDLKNLPEEIINEMISGKEITPLENPQLHTSSDGSKFPSVVMTYNQDLFLPPGIYRCPISSKCTIVVNGTLRMDPFALIEAHRYTFQKSVVTPKMLLVAAGFENVFVDLSASPQIPTQASQGAPGAAATYKSVITGSKEVCTRWVIICVSKGSVPVYSMVVDKPAVSGGQGETGTAGNAGGELEISFLQKPGHAKSIQGNITLLSLGSNGGRGGNGGVPNGGPSVGKKGVGGKGGGGGSLSSTQLLTNPELLQHFKILSLGGHGGPAGKGAGEDIPGEHGQNGIIHANSY